MRPSLNLLVLAAAVLALGAGTPWIAGHLRSLPDPQALSARSQERIVTLEVGGMTCAACAGTIQSGLEAVPGVSTVTVRYPQHRAYVVASRSVPDSALIGAIRRSGPGFMGLVAER